MSSFQSTRPQGARQRDIQLLMKHVRFQSTRPQGARPVHTYNTTPTNSFNPRARRGRDLRGLNWWYDGLRFNPRARRGRDRFPRMLSIVIVQVSIHAPAGGATLAVNVGGAKTPFQSTRPQGARHREYMQTINPERVSIHAPAGGATNFGFSTNGYLTFQSTRPQGARPLPQDA